MPAGSPSGRTAASIAVTASPSATPGARLKLSVTDGNCAWRFTASAVRVGSYRLNELRQRAEAFCDPRSPRVELPDVVPLERVLVLRVPHAAARADVLHCLEEGGGPRHAGHTSAQSRDHLVGADLPLRERLQHDEHARGVGGGAGPVTLTTRESHHVRDRRVVPDDVDD